MITMLSSSSRWCVSLLQVADDIMTHSSTAIDQPLLGIKREVDIELVRGLSSTNHAFSFYYRISHSKHFKIISIIPSILSGIWRMEKCYNKIGESYLFVYLQI